MLPIFQKFVKSVKKENKNFRRCSEAFGTFYNNGKSVGSLGDIGVFSFNGNKIITTGNGGAIVLIMICKQMRIYFSSNDDNIKYLHNEIGFNYRFSGLNVHWIRSIKKIQILYG